MAIRFFDMFAGIGGFRSGLEAVGDFECIGHCEIDKYANKAYHALYEPKGEIYYEDATKINPAEVPDIDLICAGFPCQSYPEKKNIPKNRNKWHGKGKRFREIRDKILDAIWYNYYAGIA